MARVFSAASSQYLQASTNISEAQNATHLTMAMWFARTTSVSYGQFSNWGDNNNHAHGIHVWNDGNVYFTVRNGSASFGSVSASGTAMRHWAMVFDGSQSTNPTRLRGYVNGVNQALTFTGTIPALTSNDAALVPMQIGRTLGGSAATNYANGAVSECAIWAASLSDDEVAALSAGYSPLLVRPGSLVSYWPLHGRAGASGAEEDWVGGYPMSAFASPSVGDHPRIIYPRRRVEILVPTAAGANTYTLSAATFAPGSITATGVTPRVTVTVS